MSFLNNYLCFSSCIGFGSLNFELHSWGSLTKEARVARHPKNPKNGECMKGMKENMKIKVLGNMKCYWEMGMN